MWDEFFHFYGFAKKRTGFLITVENRNRLSNIHVMLEERRGEYEGVKEHICVPRAWVVERRFAVSSRLNLKFF